MKWLSICIAIIALFAMLNLNQIYIATAQPMVFPYPPYEAIKNDDVVFYNEFPKVNSELIHQFVESFENSKRAKLTLTFYKEEPKLFSKYFITTPVKKYLLEYNGENHIMFSDVSSDMIIEMEFHDIKVVNSNGLQVYRLIDEIKGNHFDLVAIPSK